MHGLLESLEKATTKVLGNDAEKKLEHAAEGALKTDAGKKFEHAADAALKSDAGKQLTAAIDSGDVGKIVSSGGFAIKSLISEAYKFIAAHLPFDWGMSEEEENDQDSSFSQFSTYMAQPTTKPIYQKELQQLDSIGVVDLSRITRDQWPKKDTSYFALIAINTYEKETYVLDSQVVHDAINIAQIYKAHGYRLAYLFNASAKKFYEWVDFFIERVKKEVAIYFAGIGVNVVSGNNITQVLAFRDVAKSADGTGGSGATHIQAALGVNPNSVSEEQLLDIVDRTAKANLRTVLITNVVNKADAFTPDASTPILAAGSAAAHSAKHRVPPHGSIYIQNNGASQADQHALVDQLQKNGKETFAQLKTLHTGGGITITANDDALLAQPVILPIPSGDEELQVEDVTQHMIGTDPAKITSVPDPNTLTPAEVEGAEQRWLLFVAEMKKSPAYDSKYKAHLEKLDAMGCINLERLDRAQIPSIRIDRVAALFFCPYEDLPHTLQEGPINDGLTMANLYHSKGYKIVYLMDATPKEFYSWMDWLLSNIRGEIVVYFSGHGTQMKDTTGKEADGKSELLVFYNDSKKATSLPKIPAQPGFTDMTVSDDCLHRLITLKDYPDTRVVLISDCCHSGTMYNFDEPVDLKPNRPPLNVVAIGAAKDEQTAKQTVLGGKDSGVFTYSFNTVIKQKETATFVDLEAYTKKNIAKYQDINITTTDPALLKTQIITPSKLSADPKAHNYSPVLLTDAELQSRSLKHTTVIPADGVRVRRPHPKARPSIVRTGGAHAATAPHAAATGSHTTVTTHTTETHVTHTSPTPAGAHVTRTSPAPTRTSPAATRTSPTPTRTSPTPTRTSPTAAVTHVTRTSPTPAGSHTVTTTTTTTHVIHTSPTAAHHAAAHGKK